MPETYLSLKLMSIYVYEFLNLPYGCMCRWGILFSHPKDFTPVCTTELSRLAKLTPEFQKRGVKVLALSCDSVETHHEWIKVKYDQYLNQIFNLHHFIIVENTLKTKATSDPLNYPAVLKHWVALMVQYPY
jgi:alkyl hydroperoxide reductase subunit AhpC